VTHDRYQIAGPKIVHEYMDDELVILNLDNGFYYSLTNGHIELFKQLECGRSEAEVVERLVARYGADKAALEATVSDLTRELVTEGILRRSEGAAAGLGSGETRGGAPDAPPAAGKLEFTPLQKFTDVKDLLMLDPIHEVCDTGWPNKGASVDAPQA
jgi:hypothetical protein